MRPALSLLLLGIRLLFLQQYVRDLAVAAPPQRALNEAVHTSTYCCTSGHISQTTGSIIAPTTEQQQRNLGQAIEEHRGWWVEAIGARLSGLASMRRCVERHTAAEDPREDVRICEDQFLRSCAAAQKGVNRPSCPTVSFTCSHTAATVLPFGRRTEEAGPARDACSTLRLIFCKSDDGLEAVTALSPLSCHPKIRLVNHHPNEVGL